MGLTFEPAHYVYWDFIRKLRNNPDVKKGFVNQEHITVPAQQSYMSWHWDNYYVAVDGGETVGYCGVVDDDIRFCVHPDSQGKGYGSKMLDFLAETYPLAIGKVKHGNVPSSKAFGYAGYDLFKEDEEFLYYKLPDDI